MVEVERPLGMRYPALATIEIPILTEPLVKPCADPEAVALTIRHALDLPTVQSTKHVLSSPDECFAMGDGSNNSISYLIGWIVTDALVHN